MPTSSKFAVAVHVLALMALKADEPLKSEQIAASVNTNAVVIRRILCALAAAGLVASQTGAAGGSRLARPAEEITLRDVYRAVESGNAFSLHRQQPNQRCLVGVNIEAVMGGIQQHVDGAVDRALGEITLAQILLSLKPCPEKRSNRKRAQR